MMQPPTALDFQNVLECVEEATGFKEKSDSMDSFNKIRAFVQETNAYIAIGKDLDDIGLAIGARERGQGESDPEYRNKVLKALAHPEITPILTPKITQATIINPADLDAKFKEAIAKCMEAREHFVARFLVETGLKPSECRMVEDHSDPFRIVLTFEKKP